MTNKINDENNEILKWTSHPFVDYPKQTILLVIFIIVIGIGLWQIAVSHWDMPLFYYLGMLILLLSLISYFIPTYYMIFEDKIEIKYWMIKIERKYSDFGCFYIDRKGVMLGTFKMPRRLDSFRGTSLRFSKDKQEKDHLIEILTRKIGKQY